jgi:hypothetical protein
MADEGYRWLFTAAAMDEASAALPPRWNVNERLVQIETPTIAWA